MDQVHGTCVEVDRVGVLVRGPPGSGKSDLALRLIDGGARLVADDRVDLELRDGGIVASAPAEIGGMLEVRGLGVLRLDRAKEAALGLVIDLLDGARIERLPRSARCTYLGLALPLVGRAPFEASAAAKVRLAVAWAKGRIIPVP